MPGMDGLRAAREITSRHQVAVLLLTAFSQRDLIEEARDSGVVGLPGQAVPTPGAAAGHRRRAGQGAPGLGHRGDEAEHSADGAEDKIATRRVVDEAKQILMDRDDLPEDEAFGFIQRTAMQTRARMRDVAQQVVDGTLTPRSVDG